MRLATSEAFAADPAEVHAFYNLRRRGVVAAAHHALARLEACLPAQGGRLFLCTQNVDELHERAGVARRRARARARQDREGALPRLRQRTRDPGRPCDRPGLPRLPRMRGSLRPDVVRFGEGAKHPARIEAALAEADQFVATRASGAVYPAAGYAGAARRLGIRTVGTNLEPADNSEALDEVRHGLASATIPVFVNDICGFEPLK